MSSTPDLLREELRTHDGDAAVAWIEQAAARASIDDVDGVCGAYTAAARRTIRTPLATPRFTAWTGTDAARALLLLLVAERVGADAFETIARECYDRGDSREQQSWLKALPLFPDAARYLPIAIDACRTNIVPQFEAIACENPYPARYFPDLHFNQLVLKSMFMGVALARIVDLDDRLNPELSRMALDYAAERRAAGRTIPADIARALARDVRSEAALP